MELYEIQLYATNTWNGQKLKWLGMNNNTLLATAFEVSRLSD